MPPRRCTDSPSPRRSRPPHCGCARMPHPSSTGTRWPSTAVRSRSETLMSTTDHIRIPKAAELVADTLRRRIITGEYARDELLPSETALMEHFNVARTTVRDAVRILESEGLLVVRRGANGGGRV